MDKRITTNVVVGAFVLIGFGLFLFLIMTVGGGTGLFTSRLELFGRFSHVKGLHAGSEVSLSGLRVGTVKKIEIANDGSKDLIVDLMINKEVADKLRKDSIAKVATQGVLGDKYVELTIGSNNEAPLNNGDFIHTEEVEDLFTKSGGLVDDISRQFMKGGDFDALVKNLNKTAANLASLTEEAKAGKGLLAESLRGDSGAKLNRSLGHVESILGKIDRGEGTLGGLINDPTVYEDLKSIMGGAKRSSILQYFMRQFKDSGDKTKR